MSDRSMDWNPGIPGPSSPPIYCASVYSSHGDPKHDPYTYGRFGNPTWEALELALGDLEGASAVAFASGQAASLALILSLAESRSRFVLPGDGYFGARSLFAGLASRNLVMELADHKDLTAIGLELSRGPSVLWSESPTNPFLRVFDLKALARKAKEHGAPFIVDNTTATSVLQRPLDLGATATVVSLTKSLSGHSDVILGAVTSRDEDLLTRVRGWRSLGGGIPGPFEAWIAHRGISTVSLRVQRQSENAQEIAEFLLQHDRVSEVYYPGLSPERELASSQMSGGFGPLLSFTLDGTASQAEKMVREGGLFRPATSFGGVHSSWERRARWPGEDAPQNLIRLSVGIEPIADLLAALEAALSLEE